MQGLTLLARKSQQRVQLCNARKDGCCRTTARLNFENNFLKKGAHDPALQARLTREAARYKAACYKSGMCAAAPQKGNHLKLHKQLLTAISEQLGRRYGESVGKEVFLSGDTLVKVAWRACREDADAPAEPKIESKFFLIAPRPCRYGTLETPKLTRPGKGGSTATVCGPGGARVGR